MDKELATVCEPMECEEVDDAASLDSTDLYSSDEMEFNWDSDELKDPTPEETEETQNPSASSLLSEVNTNTGNEAAPVAPVVAMSVESTNHSTINNNNYAGNSNIASVAAVNDSDFEWNPDKVRAAAATTRSSVQFDSKITAQARNLDEFFDSIPYEMLQTVCNFGRDEPLAVEG
jgi:hypothetical protein